MLFSGHNQNQFIFSDGLSDHRRLELSVGYLNLNGGSWESWITLMQHVKNRVDLIFSHHIHVIQQFNGSRAKQLVLSIHVRTNVILWKTVAMLGNAILRNAMLYLDAA